MSLMGALRGLFSRSRAMDAREVLLQGPAHLGTVETEWIDFDRDFSVPASDRRVGHEVTTQRLMDYLHDRQVRQPTVRGSWLIAPVKAFRPDDLRETARMLLGARERLPRRALGR